MTPENTTPSTQPASQPSAHPQTSEVTLRGIMVALIIFGILAILGTIFGIYGTVQANRALSELGTDLAEETDVEDFSSYGKPSSVEDIEYVTIVYNNNLDYIDIINDGEDSSINYYTYDADDDYVGDAVETNVTDILQYIIDNDLDYLGDNEYLDEETWSIEISSTNGYSYISGNDAAPEWFNALLKKLDVDTNGYYSKKL